MNWPELLQGLAIAGLAFQGVYLGLRLNKVIDLSIRQGKALAQGIAELEKKVNKND